MKDGFTHVHATPPPGAAADWTISQNWDAFTADEHAMWDKLFARQSAMLPGRASEAFLRGIDVLRLEKPGIPDYRELNARADGGDGVAGGGGAGPRPRRCVFRPSGEPAAFPRAISSAHPEQLDYLQEPDVFHDVFGHVPMLADPVFADYMVAYGEGGLRSLQFDALKQLARLYWYNGRIRTHPRGRWPAHLRRRDCVVLRRKRLRARQRQPEPDRVRSRAGDADRLPDRRFPAELLRHRQPRPVAGHDGEHRFRAALCGE